LIPRSYIFLFKGFYREWRYQC